MVLPKTDNRNGSEEGSSRSATTGGKQAPVNGNFEVPPNHLEPYLGTQAGEEMSVDPTAPAINAESMEAPSETAVIDGTDDNVNLDDDEEEDDLSYSDDSSESSVHTPTSVISYSLISSYRMIDGVSSDSEADTDDNDTVEVFVIARCLICRRDYIVPRGAIVCTRCGYPGLVHSGDD